MDVPVHFMHSLWQQFCLCILCGSSLTYILIIYDMKKLDRNTTFMEMQRFIYIYIILIFSIIIATTGIAIHILNC